MAHALCINCFKIFELNEVIGPILKEYKPHCQVCQPQDFDLVGKEVFIASIEGVGVVVIVPENTDKDNQQCQVIAKIIEYLPGKYV